MLEFWPVCISLSLGVVLLLMSAIWGGTLISLVSELLGWISANNFLDKFALQLCRMSLLGLVVLTVLLATSIVLGTQVVEVWKMGIFDFSEGFWRWPGAILLGGTFFQIVSFFTWGTLKKNKKGLHLFVSLISALAIWVGSYAAVNLKLGYGWGHGLETVSGRPFLVVLSPLVPGILWPVAIWFVLLCLGGAGTVAGVYLLMRRNRDDFGRDYYTRVQPRAARWGLLFSLQIFILVWAVYSGFLGVKLEWESAALLRAEFLGTGLGALVCFALQFFVVLFLTRSRTPLRMKGSLILSLILAWAALSLSALFVFLISGAGLHWLA